MVAVGNLSPVERFELIRLLVELPDVDVETGVEVERAVTSGLMSLASEAPYAAAVLVRSRQVQDRLDRHHLDEVVDRLFRDGWSPELMANTALFASLWSARRGRSRRRRLVDEAVDMLLADEQTVVPVGTRTALFVLSFAVPDDEDDDKRGFRRQEARDLALGVLSPERVLELQSDEQELALAFVVGAGHAWLEDWLAEYLDLVVDLVVDGRRRSRARLDRRASLCAGVPAVATALSVLSDLWPERAAALGERIIRRHPVSFVSPPVPRWMRIEFLNFMARFPPSDSRQARTWTRDFLLLVPQVDLKQLGTDHELSGAVERASEALGEPDLVRGLSARLGRTESGVRFSPPSGSHRRGPDSGRHVMRQPRRRKTNDKPGGEDG